MADEMNVFSGTVRRLEARDEARWRSLFHGYTTFYKEIVPRDVEDATWQRLLDEQDGLSGLVAETSDGKVIGFANLVFHRSTWSAGWYCYLEDLFVDASARKSGAGRALIQATYALADQRGVSRTYWATQGHNATARRLYDEVGELTEFVQYRRRETQS
jgi:GNAT superfamily N-acetyltransferase